MKFAAMVVDALVASEIQPIA